ncbi:serine/threonine-protein kinase [Herbiconiux sp.]|uniref:serine/threonine-protein kinase n=1 Tax=Herbiconiux sp. TaxID=1871186 RepID=UPI0025B9A4A4|nr:serine/threonine-protein kinase [Herbiconiux sp.]
MPNEVSLLTKGPSLTEQDVLDAIGGLHAEFLGIGSFGETWSIAGLEGVPDPSAAKILHEGSFNPRRLKRETDALERLDSAGIVDLYEVRVVTLGGIDRTVLICELIPGMDVEDKLAIDGRPNYAHVRKFAMGLLIAVRDMHDADTWHRDIKPANILLRDGRWKSPVLIDFGLSRAVTDATMTAYPQRVGTLRYMAPEALRGEPARKLADLWSCGVILYELIAGTHPFISSFVGLAPDDVVDEVVGDPRPLPGDVPDDLRELVLRLLSQSPHLRGSARRAIETLKSGAARD